MIAGNLNHNFNRMRDQEVVDPEVRALISEIRSMTDNIDAKSRQYEKNIESIYEKWESEVNGLEVEFGDIDNQLLEDERRWKEDIDIAALGFIDGD